jgi:hypothetical protein
VESSESDGSDEISLKLPKHHHALSTDPEVKFSIPPRYVSLPARSVAALEAVALQGDRNFVVRRPLLDPNTPETLLKKQNLCPDLPSPYLTRPCPLHGCHCWTVGLLAGAGAP